MPGRSPTLLPNDHVRMLTELLRPAGAELARRWLAALLIAPEAEREALVDAVEARMASLYAVPESGVEGDSVEPESLLHVADEPVFKDELIEQTIRSYAVRASDGDDTGKGKSDSGEGVCGRRSVR